MFRRKYRRVAGLVPRPRTVMEVLIDGICWALALEWLGGGE